MEVSSKLNNSTLKEMYELTTKLEGAFRIVNQSLKSLIIISDKLQDEGPQIQSLKSQKLLKKSRQTKQDLFLPTNDDSESEESDENYEQQNYESKKVKVKKKKVAPSFFVQTQPINPYYLFYKEQKTKMEKQTKDKKIQAKHSRIIMDMWKALTVEEKERYGEVSKKIQEKKLMILKQKQKIEKKMRSFDC